MLETAPDDDDAAVVAVAVVAVAHRPPVPGDLLLLRLVPMLMLAQAEVPFVPGHSYGATLLLPALFAREEEMANCSLDVMWAQ